MHARDRLLVLAAVAGLAAGTSAQAPVTYCTPKTSTAGCVTTVSTSDLATQPVSGAADYFVLAKDVQGFKNGLMIFGLQGQAAIPFAGGGVLCMAPPLGRGTILLSFGSSPLSCDGSYSQVVNDGGATNPKLDLGPGTRVWCQWWYRTGGDCGPGCTALSDAVELTYQ